jgi:hypothetical protein
LFCFFRTCPQASSFLHRFRTAAAKFAVAENSGLRESAITAGVDDMLPVIAQGWFCGGFAESQFRTEPQ